MSNNRLNFSKECLYLAMIKLVNDNPIGDISISQLVKEAGISRSTFYRHYKSIYDLIEEYITNFILGYEHQPFYMEDHSTFSDRVRASFSTIKSNKILLLKLRSSSDSNLYYRCLHNLVENTFKNRSAQVGFSTDYERAALIGMVFSMTQLWIDHDCDISIEEISSTFEDIVYAYKRQKQKKQ